MQADILKSLFSRSNKILYRSFAVVVIAGFAASSFSISYGGALLASRALKTPLGHQELHFEVLVTLGVPLLVIGVSMILVPAYSSTTQRSFSILLIAGLLISATLTRITSYLLPHDHLESLSIWALLLASLINLISSIECFLASRRRWTRFFRVMNVLFTLSLSAISIYTALYMLKGVSIIFEHRLYYIFPVPVVFSVMLRTDPFTRKYYNKRLDTLLWTPPVLSMISSTVSAIYILTENSYASIAADILFASALATSSIAILTRSSGARPLEAYVFSIRAAHVWGLASILIAIFSLLRLAPISRDLFIHVIMLGFIGNVFAAYSRFLLPLRPFATVLPKALNTKFMWLLNLMIALRITSSIQVPKYLELAIHISAGALAIVLIIYIIYNII